MTSRLNPYLSFQDNARAAMEFYQRVFGGQLAVSTFGEFNMAQNPDEKDKVMHAMLEAPNGFVLMGADTPSYIPFSPGTNYSISLSGEDETELRTYWDKLAEGANIAQPLTAAPWGDSFGSLTDRFGIQWMVNIAGKR